MLNKKLILGTVAGAVLAFTTGSFASGVAHACPPVDHGQPHFYFGAGAGYGNQHWNNQYNSAVMDAHPNAFAGQVFGGYAFNNFLSVQGDATLLTHTSFTLNGQNGETKEKTYALDLVGRLTVPPMPGATNLRFFGFVGPSLLRTELQGVVPAGMKEDRNHFGVTYGAGATYKTSQNCSLFVKWQRFGGNGINSLNQFQASVDVFLIGGEYHIA